MASDEVRLPFKPEDITPAMAAYARMTLARRGLEESDPPPRPHEPAVSTPPQNETDVEMAPVPQVPPNRSTSRKGRGRKVSEKQFHPSNRD